MGISQKRISKWQRLIWEAVQLPLVIREMQSLNAISAPTHTRVALMEKKNWQLLATPEFSCVAGGVTLENKLAYLLKLNTCLPYGPATPLLECVLTSTEWCTKMFIVAFFTIANNWRPWKHLTPIETMTATYVYSGIWYIGATNFFCGGSESKYFRIRGPYYLSQQLNSALVVWKPPQMVL